MGKGGSQQTPSAQNESTSQDNNDNERIMERRDDVAPPQRTIDLWRDVGIGIDSVKPTVAYVSAVESLNEANHYYRNFDTARKFVESYMGPVIRILLEQQFPQNIGSLEINSIEESLKYSTMIIAEDLKLQNEIGGGDCKILDVLGLIFNPKQIFYKSLKLNWNSNVSGAPEVRIQKIIKFRAMGGFGALGKYLSSKSSFLQFPPLDTLHPILIAATDAIPVENGNPDTAKKKYEDDLISVTNAVIKLMINATEDSLKNKTQSLSVLQKTLQNFFGKMLASRRKETYSFYESLRGFALKLITSQSLPLKLHGWDTVADLIQCSIELRPAPKAFLVSGAGCEMVNGLYEFSGELTEDGYAKHLVDIKYEYIIPNTNLGTKTKEKKLTLFRCNINNGNSNSRPAVKSWFLSEADEDLPGTAKDIDYYHHKSKNEYIPPLNGWVTCGLGGRASGIEPPPTLAPKGLMVPTGENYNTMEHQFAKWAISNGIIELVLGDSIHREIVARSIPLIRFLAYMCNRDEVTSETTSHGTPNAYCLQSSHLKLAWETCTSKLDAAVSTEIYQLLVTILPSLPENLAISLLNSIQESLTEGDGKSGFIFEVAQFCFALAVAHPVEVNTSSNNYDLLQNSVRSEILMLLWSVLTHRDASSLKCYDSLKNYVTKELRVEPLGTSQRVSFLTQCMRSLTDNSNYSCDADFIDENLALRMVKLTKFILEACPRDQIISLVKEKNELLPNLLFNELRSYLHRRKTGTRLNMIRKKHHVALTERLHILRFVYGISEDVCMTSSQLDLLWKLCNEPADREAAMIFLAYASNDEVGPDISGNSSNENRHSKQQIEIPGLSTKQLLKSAFVDEVKLYAFKHIFCSVEVDWESLGASSYHSFQTLFKSLNKSLQTSLTFNGPALDALWRISLSVGNNDVASLVMKDLLSVYGAMTNSTYNDETNSTFDTNMQDIVDNEYKSFSQRMFECLEQVKLKLESGNDGSEKSAERCIRILNAAVSQSVVGGDALASVISSSALSSISTSTTLTDLLQSVPHGMRGQSCLRTIRVVVKHTPGHNRSSNESNLVTNDLPSKSLNTERFSLQVHPLEPLSNLRSKVSHHCQYQQNLVKPLYVSISNTCYGERSSSNNSRTSLSSQPDYVLLADLGIVEGCEVDFLLASHPFHESRCVNRGNIASNDQGLDSSAMFNGDEADNLFDILFSILEALPQKVGYTKDNKSTSQLVWDLLLSVASNAGIIDQVRYLAQTPINYSETSGKNDENSMPIDSWKKELAWHDILNTKSYQRSVYVMQVIDSFLQPANEIIHSVKNENQSQLMSQMNNDSLFFRQGFMKSRGFEAILHFFLEQQSQGDINSTLGSMYALRILHCCLFGKSDTITYALGEPVPLRELDATGEVMINTISDFKPFFEGLTSVVISDTFVFDNTILDILSIIRTIIASGNKAKIFASLPDSITERFIIKLLLWESKTEFTIATNYGTVIRRTTEELILEISSLLPFALPWLIKALKSLDTSYNGSAEFFSVLIRIIKGHNQVVSFKNLEHLTTEVMKKLASHPRPEGESVNRFSTGVLSGCLRTLLAIVQNGAVTVLRDGVEMLLKATSSTPWSHAISPDKVDSLVDYAASSVASESCDTTLINLMGIIFDYFLSDSDSSSSPAPCCDDVSRRVGFELIGASASACEGESGFLILSIKLRDIIYSTSPSILHSWGRNIGIDGRGHNALSNASIYSGLRNQGCTCYMNSVLQQLFMMPGLRKIICSSMIPSVLRSSGSGVMANGSELIGKNLSLQWENGSSYEAKVLGYNEKSRTHALQYYPLQIPGLGNDHESNSSMNQQTLQNNVVNIPLYPDEYPDEFTLSEGRPGKETGIFEVIHTYKSSQQSNGDLNNDLEESIVDKVSKSSSIEEKEEETSARRLLEEIQRTFVHLDEGVRGRCFDPRSLVEASGCLKLEFDVWQQNDASEFAMKLLDRLEVPLKRWCPSHFKDLEQTFRLKQTKQKICKKCGLKTNREENLMNIDCQIRGKCDIHEALSTMCEVEFMEGDNKVFCDRCKEKCDTVLRTAISALPDVLILSLKRFDLDYNTFETVKLNSRCAFGQTLNMKQYTLEGIEASEKDSVDSSINGNDIIMDTGDLHSDHLTALPDEDYEYILSGVLVHAGVAQGGHYYSFIKDRVPDYQGDNNTCKWYRFDDEDVTPFDPSSIESECFGGKVHKETKFANGQVHRIEQEQFANALMLFYEKVKPELSKDEEDRDCPMEDVDGNSKEQITLTSGYDVFQTDVRQSNLIHCCQSFLFDYELQYFLKNMLDLCLGSIYGDGNIDKIPSLLSGMDSTSRSQILSASRHFSMLDLSMSYFFNILLHSNQKRTIDEWTNSIVDMLTKWGDGAKYLIQELAQGTRMFGSNWFKKYLCDCPEEYSRVAAVKVFTQAIVTTLAYPDEIISLDKWTSAWSERLNMTKCLDSGNVLKPFPTPLFYFYEDTAMFDDSKSSYVGAVLSFLVLLLEIAPRTWRCIPDICVLIRDIFRFSDEKGQFAIKRSFIEAQVPARLICLILREKAPTLLKKFFPGSSISVDTVEAMSKTETNVSTQLVSLPSSTTGIGSSSGQAANANVSPSFHDKTNILEALAFLIGIDGSSSDPLVTESYDNIKGRIVVDLQSKVKDALTIIYKECVGESQVMSQREILTYMKHCGVDLTTVSQKKISNILTKYGKENKFLPLDGFLLYYRDITLAKELQVRSDLSKFGFRPDLSRRPLEARIYDSGEEKCHYELSESISIDVSIKMRSKNFMKLGQIAECGLSSLNFYSTAFHVNEVLTTYILAMSFYGQDASSLISNSLRSLYRSLSGWSANDTIQSYIMVLKILSSIPDARQKERIKAIMQQNDKSHIQTESVLGLLNTINDCSISRSTQHYNRDYQQTGILERYLEILRELQKQKEVSKWMSDHRNQWRWMEQWLQTDISPVSHYQSRRDYINARGPVQISAGNIHNQSHHNFDSDVNVPINESDDDDDDDDDSGYDNPDVYDCGSVLVQNAGCKEVNGLYTCHGICDGVSRYVKDGVWKNNEEIFSLFRCRLSDNTKKWYISIVPKNIQPGTSKDIDFYLAPASGEPNEIPSDNKWLTCKENGIDPSPTVTWKSELHPDNGIESGGIVSNEGSDELPSVGYL